MEGGRLRVSKFKAVALWRVQSLPSKARDGRAQIAGMMRL